MLSSKTNEVLLHNAAAKQKESDYNYDIKEINSRNLKGFINLPFRLYKNDQNWVPPLKYEMNKMLKGIGNDLFKNGPHTFFTVLKKAHRRTYISARILCGMNPRITLNTGEKWGYFSLFEAEDIAAGKAVIEKAIEWCKKQGANNMIGPWSPDDGEGYRGFLVSGRDGPPFLMNSYNPEWYEEVMKVTDFKKQKDLYALRLDLLNIEHKKLKILADYSTKHYGFRVDAMKDIDIEINDFYKILINSIKDEPDFPIPSLEFVKDFARVVKDIGDPSIIGIARRISDNEPLAFVGSLPNYNEVFTKLRGRLLPFGILKYIWYKKRLQSIRVIMQFCIPEYRNKGVIVSVYRLLLENALAKGYKEAEASTIEEQKIRSWKSVLSAGGKVNRVYRYYCKEI